MTTPWEQSDGTFFCPICKARVPRGTDQPCANCGADTSQPLYRTIVEADDQMFAYRTQYDEIMGKWHALAADRRMWMAQLLSTTSPRKATRQVGLPKWGDAEPSSREETEAPTWSEVMAEEAPTPRVVAPPPKKQKPHPERQPKRRLSAPTLLGISGASMLITAAIVFIAVTWETIFPLAQGLLVLAVAGAIAKLSLWLTRHELLVSGGAVGVVAMAFAGVAVIAFNRAEVGLGDYAITTALLASSVSGYLLAERDVRWVGPLAALALVATPASLALTFAGHTGSGSPALATVIGVAAGVAMGLTLRWWTRKPERWIVTVGYTVVVALSVLPAGLELASEISLDPLVLCAALLPVAVLAVAGTWMPDVTIGPAVLVLTSVIVAAVAGPTGHASSSVAAGATAAAVAIALVSFAPKTWRLPTLLGAIPIALGGLVLFAVQVWNLLAWAVAFRLEAEPPVIDEWTAVTALALAASIAATRLWGDRPGWMGMLEVSGAILATAGFAGLAFPINEMFPVPHLYGLALVLEIGGAATAATALAWKGALARKVSGIGGVSVGTLGALNAVWPLAQRALSLPVALTLALAPILVLAVAGRRWPRVTLGPAAFLVPIVAAAAVTNSDHWGLASAVGAAFVAALLWGALAMPAAWRGPMGVGLALPLASTLVASFWWTLPVVGRALVHGAVAAGPLDAWGGLTAAFTGVALAALTRWKISTVSATVLGVAGALVTLAAAASWNVEAASAWGDGRALTVAWTGCVAALVAGAFAALWVPSMAKQTSGVGAVALMTISGFNGAAAFAARETPLLSGLVALLLPIAILVVFARWWPTITLGSASLLATVAAASTAHRLDLPTEAMVAFAVAAAAVVIWAVSPLPNRLRLPASAGLIPAVWAATWTSVVALAAGLAAVPDSTSRPPIMTSWATLTMVAGAVAAAACRSGWGVAVGSQVANGMGALFAAVAAATGTAWFALSPYGSPGLVALVGTGTAILVALTALVWTTPRGRWAVGIFAAGWATYGALPTLVKVANGDYPLWPGLGAVAVTIGVLVAGSVRWPTITLGSVSLLGSLAAIAGVSARADTWEKVAIAAAAVVAVVAWIAKFAGRMRATPLLAGILPAGGFVVGALWVAFWYALARWWSEFFSSGSGPTSVFLALVTVLAAAALLASRAVILNVGWAMLPFALVVSSSLPHPWPAVILLAAGVAGVTAAPQRPEGGWHVHVGATVAFFGVGVGWAVGAPSGLAVAALVAAGAAGWLTVRAERLYRDPALVATPVFAAIAAGVGMSAMGGEAPAAYGTAMAAAMGVSLWIRRVNLDPEMTITFTTIGVATLFVPLFAPSLTAAGVAMLIAGAGWLGHAVLGSRQSRWVSSLVLSLGAAEVLAGAQVNVIEAYTAVPAGTVLAIGLWWLAEDSEVRTFRALGPGLGLALIPSYFALALQPDSLARTLALTAATVFLALVGVTLRWFAPIVATAVTAVTVSLTQVAVGSDIVPRWVSFGIVGAILLAIAATYEKLQRLR